jgi:hypothetical protein
MLLSSPVMPPARSNIDDVRRQAAIDELAEQIGYRSWNHVTQLSGSSEIDKSTLGIGAQ